jgi:hypothetical protein
VDTSSLHDRSFLSGAVVVFAVLLSLAVPPGISAQTAAHEIAEFAFVVRTTDNSIDLRCRNGCAWKTLRFSAQVDGAPQAVDQYGITRRGDERSEDLPGLAAFLFTIQRTAEGVKLQGRRGSTWTSLSFSCPTGGCEQTVDQFGIATAEAR